MRLNLSIIFYSLLGYRKSGGNCCDIFNNKTVNLRNVTLLGVNEWMTNASFPLAEGGCPSFETVKSSYEEVIFQI